MIRTGYSNYGEGQLDHDEFNEQLKQEREQMEINEMEENALADEYLKYQIENLNSFEETE